MCIYYVHIVPFKTRRQLRDQYPCANSHLFTLKRWGQIAHSFLDGGGQVIKDYFSHSSLSLLPFIQSAAVIYHF